MRKKLLIAAICAAVMVVAVLVAHNRQASSRQSKLRQAHRVALRRFRKALLDNDVKAADTVLNSRSGRSLVNAVFYPERHEYPLHFAAYAKPQMVRTLIKHGAQLDAEDYQGATPLHTASAYGNAETARILLDSGASVNARDHDGWTPLHSALGFKRGRARSDIADMLKFEDYQWCDGITPLLIGHGANVNAKDKYGDTPLHVAVRYASLLDTEKQNARWSDARGQIDRAISLLLKSGADPSVKNREGDTPLDLATRAGAKDLVRMLRGSLFAPKHASMGRDL